MPSGSRTRDSHAGGGRSNKERQRLQPLASVARVPLFEVRGVRFTLTPRAYTFTPEPHSHPGHGTNVTPLPGPHRPNSYLVPSGSRTRDYDAGGRRSNKERQRLQPLASVDRAPLFEVRGVRFYTDTMGIHIRYTYMNCLQIYVRTVTKYLCKFYTMKRISNNSISNSK